MSCVWYLVILVLQAIDTTVSSMWPGGTYGLLQPKTGCPTEWKKNSRWKEQEWIYQTTIDASSARNKKSKSLHADGFVVKNTVLRYFCVKTEPGGSLTWPKGRYCLYNRDTIRGMYWGMIAMMDDKGNDSGDVISKFTSIFADLNINAGYIDLYFSCQTSGSKKIPIELPITKPFYLLPYGSSECQQVKWMVATTEWIKYHTRDYQGHHYKGGTVPYYELGDINDKGITMYYCYYQSCKYTLTNKTGVFQSPGFPRKYPDGQLCSWRIMVPANHTLHVHFTNFSLDGNEGDYLRLYKNISGIFKLQQAFYGDQQPFTITFISDVILVFRSDEENNSNGFRAEYNLFTSPECTSTAVPEKTAPTTLPTTGKSQKTHPTTKLLTTKEPKSKQQTTTHPINILSQRTKLQTTKLPTTKLQTTKQPTTTHLTSTLLSMTKQPTTTTELPLVKLPTIIQSTTLRTRTTTIPANNYSVYAFKKSCACDVTWKIVVIAITLVSFILIFGIIVGVICRGRLKDATKSGTINKSVEDEMIVNPTYERGDIVLSEPNDTAPAHQTLITSEDVPLSRNEPPDYEDLDYTETNEITCPNMDNEYPECNALELISNNVPEVVYHVLDEPADLDSTYENPAEEIQCSINIVYESGDNFPPLVEANKVYDKYIA